MAKILLVEDDTQLAVQLKNWFSREGHLLEIATTGEDALQLLTSFSYDVILLDWSLPGISGLEVCRQQRKIGSDCKIIFLTGKGDIVDKETGLDLGADDYVTKPFSCRELSARVRTVLRRPTSLAIEELRIHNIVLDLKMRTVSSPEGSQHLMPREAAILEFLMRHPGRVFTSQELAKELWPSDQDVTAETARSWIRNLRVKLSAIGADALIKTIPKAGYVIEPR